jgi:hypothetical protein
VQGQNAAPGVILGEKFARDTVLVGTGVPVPVSAATNLYLDYERGAEPGYHDAHAVGGRADDVVGAGSGHGIPANRQRAVS